LDIKYLKFDIVYATLKFDENKKVKARPVLLLENDNVYNVFDIYKITTKNNNDNYNYEIKKWKEAGLKEPSYIKLKSIETINKDVLAKDKLGTLQDEDIKGMNKKLVEIALIELEKEKNEKEFSEKIQIPENILKSINKDNDGNK